MRRRAFLFAGSVSILRSFAVRAQQKAMPVIGHLSSGNVSGPNDAFCQGLSEAGFVEGQNLVIERRSAEGRYDRLPTLVADLVDRKVELIATIGLPAALAAKSATSTIPIVFNVGVDPVAEGLVVSLARPSGNLTGVTIMSSELMPKRLQLLSELVPRTQVIAMLVNPNNASAVPQSSDLQNAARTKGVQIHILKASTESEIDIAFGSLVPLHTDALVVGTDVFFFNRRDQLAALAARVAVPAVYEARAFAVAGGLISYGPSLAAMNRQLGNYAAKILKGARPSSLPVEQPQKFELVINMKTANALGLAVPQSLLARADEVIE